MNRCLEDYLRCFTAEQPKTWVKFLHWAEWSYNTSWQSSIEMTPFQDVYGRAPPSLQDYSVGSSIVAFVDELLASRDEVLA